MSYGKKKSILPYIPGYDNNAILKLTFFVAGVYIMFAVAWAITMIVYGTTDIFNTYFLPNVGLPLLAVFKHRPWTLITYGFFHFPNTFMKVISDMLWLYCFGSVTQMLIGKKHITPLFVYSLLSGGIFCLAAQLLPGALAKVPSNFVGCSAGLMGMAVAAYTLSPKYRFYLSETFSIPIAVVAGVFAVLMFIETGFYLPLILMLVGGGLTGFAYIKLLKAGYRPADWIYAIIGKIEQSVTPDEGAIRQRNSTKRNNVLTNIYKTSDGISQKRIDDILDKINQKGYNSLSKEEKEVLFKASGK